MIFRNVVRSALSKLPAAIWIPSGDDDPVVYRGTPLEIVREMANDLEEPNLEAAVGKILLGLSQNRRVQIVLPDGLPEEQLSGLFVHALLATGVGREMALA